MTDPYNTDDAASQPTQPQPTQQPAGAASSAQQPTQQQAPVPPQVASQGYQASQQPYQQPYQQASYQQQPYQQSYQQTNYQAPVNAANPAQQAKQPKKMSPTAKTFGVAFAGAALACVIGIGGFSLVNGGKTASGNTVTLGASTNTEITAQDSDDSLAETVASKALPSVAAIDVYTEDTSSSLFGYGYGSNGSSSSSSDLTESSLGSGVVLSEDGYIITNNHVIEGAAALKVTVGGEEYDADVVGTDESSDIAVVKLRDASGLTPIELGDSDNLTTGEWVMSIGSPFGLEQSVATGIVSATSRSQIMSNSSSSSGSDGYGYGYGYGNGSSSSSSSSGYTIYPNLIQTDAAINPGNSGGALVDKNGKLIGINTLITSYSGNYSGVGFAIPVNYAVNIAQQIIEGKTPTHAQLGVTLSTVNSQNAKRYGLSVDSGAYVTGVSADSGAATAGLQSGDIVTKFEGNKVESASDLMLDVRSKNPGDTVTIEVNRDGETKTLQVTLGSDESSQTSSSSSSTQKNSSSSGSNESLLNRLFNNGSSSSSKSDA